MPERSSSPRAADTAPGPAAQRSWPARLRKWAWLPLPILLVTMVLLWVVNPSGSYDLPVLIMILNFFFSTLISLFIAYQIGRSFMVHGNPGLMLMGCGVLIWGLAGLVGTALGKHDVNLAITIHNSCVWLSALCHLAGVICSLGVKRTASVPGWAISVAYGASVGVIGLIVLLAYGHWLPFFFIQGQGGTPLRQIMLGSAIALFLLTAAFLWTPGRKSVASFAYWYSLALCLFAAGLFGVMIQPSIGSGVGWAGRVAQILAGVYMLIAALAAVREQRGLEISLPVDEAWRENEFLARLRQQTPLGLALRYGLAVVVAAAASGVREALTAWVGPGLPTYVLFYPAVMAAAMLGGLGPGLVATALTGLAAEYFYLPPVGQFAIASPVDRLGLVIFTGMGLSMSAVAELYRRNREKAAAYDREAALRESEARFRLMFEGHGVPMLLIEPDTGAVVDANLAAAAFYGYSQEHLRSMRIDQINQLPPEEVAARRQNALDLAENQFIFPHRLADGQIRWVEVHSSPVTIQGRPKLFSIMHDITARRQAEEALRESQASLEARVKGRTAELEQAMSALRESEQEFRSLAEAMPQIVWATRADGWNIYFNHQWVDYTGMTMEESYGHGWNVPFHPDDQKRAWDAWQRATNHNEPYSLECRLRRADGAYRWWLVRGSPMLGTNGEILKWFGTCTDIEEIKNTEAAMREANDRLEQRVAERTAELRESEERFRLALKNAPVSVAIQDCNFVYQWAYNQRTRKPDEIIGKTDADLFAPEDVTGILEAKRRVLESGTEVHVRHWLTSNGRRLFLDLYYEPLRDAAGEISGIGIAVVDLTEQKLAEEALRESEQRYRTLFDSLQEGFYLSRVIFDNEGRPCDIVYLDVNPAFERIMGLPRDQIVGRTAKELIPAMKPGWLEVFSKVQVTGEPAKYDSYSEQLQKHFEAFIFRPAAGQFAVLVTDITERKRAESALQTTLQRFFNILASMYSGILLVSDEGRVEFANQAFCDRFGLADAPTELEGLDARDTIEKIKTGYLYPDEAVERIREILERDLPVKGEELAMQGGRTILRDFVPLNVNGKSYGRLWIHIDITERKRAEAALRQRVEEVERLLEVVPAAVWVAHDPQCLTITGNRRANEFYEAHAEENVSASSLPEARRFFAPDGRELLPDELPMQVATATNCDVRDTELYVLLPSGGRIAMLGSAVPLRDENGEVRGCIGAFMDITARKRAEEALRESEEHFRLMGDTIPYGAWMADAEGRNIYISPLFLKLVGMTFEQVKEFGWTGKMPPEDVEPMMRRWMECVRTGRDWEGEMRFPSPDGRWHTILSRGKPVRDAQGQIKAWVGINLDITERKRAEEALREADHRKEVLLKEIHHRVKNNMQVISSLVSLQADGMQDGAVREVLRDMTDRVRSMALVHEKLYQSADLARVDFAEYTRSLLNYLWRAHGTAVPAVRLTLELEPVLLSVDAAVPCGLILNELAGNALKHAFRGRSEGEVTVVLRGDADGQVRLSVRDNGVGMPAELDWRRARSLGLRLVQMLTSQLDGTVEIRDNNGTEFEIAFGVSGKQL